MFIGTKFKNCLKQQAHRYEHFTATLASVRGGGGVKPCHVSDWLQQNQRSRAQHSGFLCESVYLIQRRADRSHFLRS